MKRALRSTLFLALLLSAAGGCAEPPPEPAAEPAPAELPAEEPAAPEPLSRMPRVPAKFTNLQVLPADIGKQDLVEIMKGISKSLGAKCDFCHLTAMPDYASDAVDHKRVAREMMRMVERINEELFVWDDAPQATCFMCHRGRNEPQLELGAPAIGHGDGVEHSP